MILKSFEIKKNKVIGFGIFVIYGDNEGLKSELIENLKKTKEGKIIKYEEAEIFKNKSIFYNEIKNRSLFDEKKIIILDRCSENILEIVQDITDESLEDTIILNCGVLEKRSKLRNFAEESKDIIIIPTYRDNSQSLMNIAKAFFTEKKISISYETLNLLVNRCHGERGFLKNELEKISNYMLDKKIISLKEISVLTNLSENYSANELVDYSLSKNINKIREILSENNYSHEDTFLIIRIFIQKTKKILKLLENVKNKKDIEKVITDHKPPIFWKDKPIMKKHLEIWSLGSINEIISKLNNIEVRIKKNNSLGLTLIKDLIFEITDTKSSSSFLSSQ